MNNKELDEKLDRFLGNLILASESAMLWARHQTDENKKYYEDYNKIAKTTLKELLEISTHQHEKTDVFK